MPLSTLSSKVTVFAFEHYFSYTVWYIVLFVALS